MGELVRQQMPALAGAGPIFARREAYVVGKGEGAGVDTQSRLVRLGICVHPNICEIIMKPGLEKPSILGFQRISTAGRRVAAGGIGSLSLIGLQRLRFFVIGRFTELRIRHAHHLLGNAVRRAFERIIDRPDRELRLCDTW